MNISRSDWPRALACQPQAPLVALLDELTAGWHIAPLQLTQTGLAMLQLRDSAFNDPYFLGEIPLARAWVEITTASGERVQGAAQRMDDDAASIERLAICDALLANQLPGWQRLYTLVENGMAHLTALQQQRDALLAKTRVDFELLNAAEEDDDD